MIIFSFATQILAENLEKKSKETKAQKQTESLFRDRFKNFEQVFNRNFANKNILQWFDDNKKSFSTKDYIFFKNEFNKDPKALFYSLKKVAPFRFEFISANSKKTFGKLYIDDQGQFILNGFVLSKIAQFESLRERYQYIINIISKKQSLFNFVIPETYGEPYIVDQGTMAVSAAIGICFIAACKADKNAVSALFFSGLNAVQLQAKCLLKDDNPEVVKLTNQLQSDSSHTYSSISFVKQLNVDLSDKKTEALFYLTLSTPKSLGDSSPSFIKYEKMVVWEWIEEKKAFESKLEVPLTDLERDLNEPFVGNPSVGSVEYRNLALGIAGCCYSNLIKGKMKKFEDTCFEKYSGDPVFKKSLISIPEGIGTDPDGSFIRTSH